MLNILILARLTLPLPPADHKVGLVTQQAAPGYGKSGQSKKPQSLSLTFFIMKMVTAYASFYVYIAPFGCHTKKQHLTLSSSMVL